MYTQQFGKAGEDMAVRYLRQQGHAILARNMFLRWAEVDIISQKGDVVYFVEVKTRRSAAYGAPQESVSAAKRRKIQIAGEYYMAKQKDIHWRALAIGVVAITFPDDIKWFALT